MCGVWCVVCVEVCGVGWHERCALLCCVVLGLTRSVGVALRAVV